MTPLQQCRDALAAMTDGCQYKTIQGDAGWHVKAMPRTAALNLARAAIAAADAELSAPPALQLAAWQAAERERCALLCESRSANGNYANDTRHECAAAIRGEV